MEGLKILENSLKEELDLIQYPKASWLPEDLPGVLDVAIIGGGMAGLAVAFALLRQGISNIQILDSSPEGYEGPWKTTARMRILRSGKELVGPAQDIPYLTFHAWYKAQHGVLGWQELYKIKTSDWMEYLKWYRKVLSLPFQNNFPISEIQTKNHLFAIQGPKEIFAKKVVLATGRHGFGGVRLPKFIEGLPKNCYAHTSEPIDFKKLIDQSIFIVGTGASALDAAATALESGASSVTLLSRRSTIPFVNKFASTVYPGFGEGYCNLSDVEKIKFLGCAFETGVPPPFESLDRVKTYPNFHIETEINVDSASLQDAVIHLKTNVGELHGNFIILATGFEIDGSQERLLYPFFENILLWKDLHPKIAPSLGKYPYLGKHYQFLEKVKGSFPKAKDLYCFNYAATLSQGLTSSDIPEISTGASRLARGITSDFFSENFDLFYQRLQNFEEPEFVIETYPFKRV